MNLTVRILNIIIFPSFPPSLPPSLLARSLARYLSVSPRPSIYPSLPSSPTFFSTTKSLTPSGAGKSTQRGETPPSHLAQTRGSSAARCSRCPAALGRCCPSTWPRHPPRVCTCGFPLGRWRWRRHQLPWRVVVVVVGFTPTSPSVSQYVIPVSPVSLCLPVSLYLYHIFVSLYLCHMLLHRASRHTECRIHRPQ